MSSAAPAYCLTGAQADDALALLGVSRAEADRALLDALIDAYTRTVPWESASRIVRKAEMGDAVTPRTPHAFWEAARTAGTGGTCFESNGAFLALLRALGYDAVPTINDMHAQIGVHTAIIVRFRAGQRVLADAGMPLSAALPLDPAGARRTESPFHTYTVTPIAPDRYAITRDRHPNPYCFTLIDRPVSDAAYRAATGADYGPDGLFLDRVILLKTIAAHVTRFDSASPVGAGIERFRDGERADEPLRGDHAHALAARFGTDATIIRAALDAVGYGRG